MKVLILVQLITLGVTPCWGADALSKEVRRVKKLKDFIQKEKTQFEERKKKSRDMVEQLDLLNSTQNQVRERMENLEGTQSELTMALENLSLEVSRHRQIETFQRHRLQGLLKILYRVKRDGVVGFVMSEGTLTQLGSRVRVLYRAIKSHAVATNELIERSERLAESESKLGETKHESDVLMAELQEQEKILGQLLAKKQQLLKRIHKKQKHYKVALRKFQLASRQVKALIDNFESKREGKTKSSKRSIYPALGSLPLPIEGGKIVKKFGKSVHKKFKTVTYYKGIEIEAPHQTPIYAVSNGDVEFEGWIKGLGNVLILHHGKGFYSIHAHLFKILASKGNKVTKGDVIGLVGDTGSSERPSLYFELRRNNKAVDPLAYFSKDKRKFLL